jgi:hypothetical protein
MMNPKFFLPTDSQTPGSLLHSAQGKIFSAPLFNQSLPEALKGRHILAQGVEAQLQALG